MEDDKIVMKNAKDNLLELNVVECSVIMVIEENYKPKNGDVICWKGYRTEDEEWMILESIIFKME